MSETNNIKTVTRYMTSDNREFGSYESAKWHADRMDKAAAANVVLDAGGSVADALRAGGWAHPIDAILERVTKETRLVISHWQCQDTPGYKVISLQSDFKFHVWGNAGSWSGPYGGSVTIEDLARYAKNEATDFEAPPPSASMDKGEGR